MCLQRLILQEIKEIHAGLGHRHFFLIPNSEFLSESVLKRNSKVHIRYDFCLFQEIFFFIFF